MLSRLLNRLFLLVELRLLPGLAQRLVLIAGLIAGMSLAGGTLVYLVDPGSDTLGSLIWWAFLHLTDSGYLGADQGTARRAVAMTLTIMGLVVFIGLLVAVMTQWLQQRIVAFERGVTRVPFRGHVIILGWTNRTISLVEELMSSAPRVQGILRERGEKSLRVVVVDEDVDHAMHLALQEGLGRAWDPRRILLRYGSPLRAEHLERVNLSEAAAVILPAVSAQDATQVSSDAQVIKTLMSARAALPEDDGDRSLPLIVAELSDPGKASIARDAWDGPLEVLATERFLAQLIAQNVRYTGLSHVFSDLLTHAHGNEIYAPRVPELDGVPFGQARLRFREGVLLGAVTTARDCVALLCPDADTTIPTGARLIVLGRSLAACQAVSSPRAMAHDVAEPVRALQTSPAPRRVLVLGWGRKLPALIRELDRFPGERVAVDIVSVLPIEQRERAMERAHVSVAHTDLRMIDAEFTSRTELEALEPWSYDDIVIVASDWIDTADEADARSVLAYLMLRQVLADAPGDPDILVELLDEDNVPMLGSARHEVIVGPRMVGHMLTNVALRRELAPVFGDIFTPGGAEIAFCAPSVYGLGTHPVRFDDLSDAVAVRGDIALGVRRVADAHGPSGGIVLNPDRATPLDLADGDQLIVVTLEPV